MRVVLVLLLLFAVGPVALSAQTIQLHDLRIDGIYATRDGDPTLYCLLGGNACIGRFPNNAWNQDPLIDRWVAAHTRAIAVPLSSRRWGIKKMRPSEPRVYLWVEDPGDSLNVALVREGHYPAKAMIDMLDADRKMLASLPPAVKARLDKQGEQGLDAEKPKRLVADSDYAAKLKRVFDAEMDAKAHQRGIWSDAGFPGRAPPKDSYLIRQFSEKRDSFEPVRALVSKYPPLAAMNRQDSTAEIARGAGVPSDAVQEYRRLLDQLGANDELSRISGFDDACLIVSDILVGAFDNGVIKGYVFRQNEPNPLVEDLENAKAAPGVDTMYHRIDDDWYLFEIWH